MAWFVYYVRSDRGKSYFVKKAFIQKTEIAEKTKTVYKYMINNSKPFQIKKKTQQKL